MDFIQVILYAVRTPTGNDILEGESVVVKTKSGEEYYGILHDAGSEMIELIAVGPDSNEEVSIGYRDIVSIIEVW
ncbi:hypothetical protein [[Clostridium] scindens]|uniref:hypothetical protein n=1 Tax=Clostridium scindens (strain JCM 10418 / VPI 12708) TaxID=29347 RepID=UPI00243326C2|nr:hypothetical protein [[Clostridium] scindens]